MHLVMPREGRLAGVAMHSNMHMPILSTALQHAVGWFCHVQHTSILAIADADAQCLLKQPSKPNASRLLCVSPPLQEEVAAAAAATVAALSGKRGSHRAVDT
jgi:hypothetical protein